MTASSANANDDRRESPRVPMKFLVRDLAMGGSYEESQGDLALGGAYFRTRYPPAGKHYEVRFRLPGMDRDLRLKGEVLVLNDGGMAVGFHVRFIDASTDDELAIARFFDGARNR